MITAVDTNVLLDVLIPQAAHGQASEGALTAALSAGAVVLAEPVYAELAVHFPGRNELDRFLADTGLRLLPSDVEVLYEAGRAWRAYRDRRPGQLVCPQCGHAEAVRCPRCGRNLAPRQHVLADFLIGAHALLRADRLLTRDRGFHATYFPRLSLTAVGGTV